MDRILIVDDMQQNIELLSTYITMEGYEVSSANTGSLALRKAKLLKPSLIILDLILPEISGYDVCKKIKTDPDTKNILVLIVTALDSKETRTRAFELGADDFITKPFDRGSLISKIKSLLRVKYLSDELEQQYARLKAQNAQLELQMKMARQVQRALVHEYKITAGGLRLTSKYMPALDIGGDLYDIVVLDDSTIGIFMSDVSGHGISAALLTSMLKILFEKTVMETSKPDMLLSQMNKTFCSIFQGSETDVYACAFYALIDTQTGRITFSNAGHALPVFLDASENTVEELSISGMPLGLMDNTAYDFKSIYYEEGDLMLFYTDGLSDSFYKDSPEDFLRTLRTLLLDMLDYAPEEILDTLVNHLLNQDESARFENDDASLILCQM